MKRIKHHIIPLAIDEIKVDGDFDAVITRLVTPTVGQTVQITHSLAREPVAVHIIQKTSFCDVKIAMAENKQIKDTRSITLVFSASFEDVTLRIW